MGIERQQMADADFCLWLPKCSEFLDGGLISAFDSDFIQATNSPHEASSILKYLEWIPFSWWSTDRNYESESPLLEFAWALSVVSMSSEHTDAACAARAPHHPLLHPSLGHSAPSTANSLPEHHTACHFRAFSHAHLYFLLSLSPLPLANFNCLYRKLSAFFSRTFSLIPHLAGCASLLHVPAAIQYLTMDLHF